MVEIKDVCSNFSLLRHPCAAQLLLPLSHVLGQINVIKGDPFGDIVVAGVSYSVNLPITSGFAPFGTDAGENFGGDPQWPENTDVYVAKFSDDGSRLLWAGYLGGEGAHPESTGRNKPLAKSADG